MGKAKMMERRAFDEVIETPRLWLVLMQSDERQFKDYRYLIYQNKDNLRAFPTLLNQAVSLFGLVSFWSSQTYANAVGLAAHYFIYKKRGNKMIGQISLTNLDYENATGELEMWIDKSQLRKGFGTEAQQALEQNFYNRGLQKVLGMVNMWNTPSLMMAQKNGFRHVGYHPHTNERLILEKVRE